MKHCSRPHGVEPGKACDNQTLLQEALFTPRLQGGPDQVLQVP